jgi:hypothetical protein
MEEKNGDKGDFTVLKRGKIKARTMERDDACGVSMTLSIMKEIAKKSDDG